MKFYENIIYDIPVNGGSYVQENKDAFEKFNFHNCIDGRYRGFVETRRRKGWTEESAKDKFNTIHLEKIDKVSSGKDKIENVIVVFCAKPKNKKTVIVGWYKDAIVYRGRPHLDNRQYNLEAMSANSTLLVEERRTFEIPRAGGRKKLPVFGFGQSNIRYADYEHYGDFINSVISYIEAEQYDSLNKMEIVEENQEYIEDGTGKKTFINTYERNPTARKECIRINGAKCAICGFDANEVYGSDYEGKIQVHHIIPIHKMNERYTIDPGKDLIPICPNCHMIIHSKINGKEISVEELKTKIQKQKHY